MVSESLSRKKYRNIKDPLMRLMFTRIMELKISETELAERAGTTRNTIRNWRTRGNSPSITTYKAVMEELGMEVKVE